jgi:hypothetical protein
MKTHKYVKRTGSPGNYKYFYKLPDGRIVASDDKNTPPAPGKPSEGQKEHIKRLIAGKIHGHHNMSVQEMAAHVGVDKKHIQWSNSNMAQAGRRHTASGEAASHPGQPHGHDFDPAHMKEAVHSATDTPEHQRDQTAAALPTPGEADRDRAATPAHPPRPARAARRLPSETDASLAARRAARTREASVSETRPPARGRPVGDTDEDLAMRTARATPGARNDDRTAGSDQPDAPAPESKAERHARMERELAAAGINLGPAARVAAPARTPTPQVATGAAGATPLGMPQTSPTAERARARSQERKISERMQTRLLDHQIPISKITALNARARAILNTEGIDPKAAADKAFDEFKAAGHITESGRPPSAAAEHVAATSPDAPAARDLAEVSPAFGEAEGPIRDMIAAQARGENPYLKRAADIFHNIQADLKPDRKAACSHVLSAIGALKASGQPLNEANLVAKYRELSGKNIRGISGIAEEFEKGTFMTLDEVISNKPIDVEMERMKRGFAARQFARVKPFLKGAFTAANPGAPPPMPTYGDIKSWAEHGGAKPDWAGTTRLALPKEMHDAAIKDATGKPQHPPSWMPIHMAPVWAYVVKSSQRDGNDPRQSPTVPINQTGMADFASTGKQAQYQEGMVKSAIRKYVVARGGAENLTDIPTSKLSEAGLTHSDIFKGEKFSKHDLSDETLHKILKHKIIDPVALLPHIKGEMSQGSMIKSFSLEVDAQLPPVNFRKSFVVDLEKSALIQKIKAIKATKAVKRA